MGRILQDTNIRSALRSRQRGFLLNPHRFGVPSGDPDFGSVQLLLHGDGADEDTATVDSSSFARSITRVGTAKLDSGQAKWGPTSMYFAGDGSRYTAAASTAWEFGTDAFSMQAWIYPTSVTDRVIFFMGWAGNNMLLLYTTGSGALGCYVGHANSGWVNFTSTAGVIVTNAWQFVSLGRTGTTLDAGVGGVQKFTGTCSAAINGSVANGAVFCVGSATWGNPFLGWIDDARVTKGVYRGNTVPTAAFPDSA